jgi:hypothetical protein
MTKSDGFIFLFEHRVLRVAKVINLTKRCWSLQYRRGRRATDFVARFRYGDGRYV